MIEDLAPAAVAAIRVAELQSRYVALRSRVDKETDAPATIEQTQTPRESELEDAVAQLTKQVAQLQVEGETAVKSAASLERINHELKTRVEMLVEAHQQSGQQASAMAYEVEAERRRLEEENAQLKSRFTALDGTVTDLNRVREKLTDEMADRSQQTDLLKAHLAALQERNSALEVTNVMLRGENASVAETVKDLEQSLRMAEDSRARFEQANVELDEKVTSSTKSSIVFAPPITE
jgi:ABC-type transporter Mla subunit MlaD